MTIQSIRRVAQVLLVGLLAVFVLAACGPGRLAPIEESNAAKKMEAPAGKALIYVYRASRFGGSAQHIVNINDKQIGFLTGRTFYLIEVSPGPVKVTSRGMNTVDEKFETQAGKTYYLRQNVAPGFGRGTTILSVMTEAEAKGEVEVCRLVQFVKM